jgi:hypothetical protein
MPGMAPWRNAACVTAALLGLAGCPSSAPVAATAPHPAPSTSAPEAPLGEVTLQAALEAAWDGDFVLCYKRARTAVSIAHDDLETMELTMRCAAAARVLPEAVAWVRSAYSLKLASPVARYGLGVATLLRGELGESRKILEKLALEAPVAGYQAAVAAQTDDDLVAAEKSIALYVKANPSDPAGRLLQTEIVCALDLARCAPILETVRSTDDDETAIARRLGAGLAGPISPSRARSFVLSKDADAINSAAFSDAYSLATTLREGSDPATILVRSPRSGRPEPSPGVDLVKQARPICRLPFATRMIQLAALGDAAAVTMHARMIALFPTELGTWRLAKRSDKTAIAARKELEKSAPVKWRATVASLLARPDEACDLSMSFPWTDRGPLATSVRARCELSLDPARGRKIADARLAVLPYGQLDVETAIEGEAAVKDPVALEELARKIAKVAPTSSLVASALWAAAETGAKKPHILFGEAMVQVSYDPHFTRKLLRKYVDQHDVPRAKLTLAQALVEAPFDAFLCGVQGEIMLNEGKPAQALPWLTKACVSARARKETEVLSPVLASLSSAINKTKGAKDKVARDAALKCAKGD